MTLIRPTKLVHNHWESEKIERNQVHRINFHYYASYSISQEICTRILLCCALLWLYIDWFSHFHQAYFTGTNDCPSASKATLMNMDKYFMWIHYERLRNHNKAKHNKTVCIFLGIYCRPSAGTVLTKFGSPLYTGPIHEGLSKWYFLDFYRIVCHDHWFTFKVNGSRKINSFNYFWLTPYFALWRQLAPKIMPTVRLVSCFEWMCPDICAVYPWHSITWGVLII